MTFFNLIGPLRDLGSWVYGFQMPHVDIKIPVIIEFAETVLKILNTGDAHNYLLSRQPEKISYYVSYDYPHEVSVYHIY